MSAKSAADISNVLKPSCGMWLNASMALLFLASSLCARILPAGPEIAPPSLPYDPAGIHIAEFTDESLLHGTVTSITEKDIVIKRSDASSLMTFPLTSTRRLTFDTERDGDAPQPQSAIQLATGDWLAADVLLIREGKAELRLAKQQRITVEQGMLDWIYFVNGPAPDIFHGPSSLEGWTSNGSWTCQDGVMRCKQMGNIGRNFQVVPDRIDLQFEMEKSEVQKNFMLSFNFTKQAGGTNKGGNNSAWSQVRLNEGQLYLYAASGNENRNSSTTLPRIATKPNDDGKFHYRILFDRPGGRMAIYINGKKVSEQATPAMSEGVWNGSLTFQPMRWGTDADWAISNIHMIPWDGQMPQADGKSTPSRLDALIMANGDMKTGRLESLLGSVIKFRSAAGIEDIPRQNVSMLRFRRAEDAVAIPSATGPKIMLTDRGELTLNSIRFADNTFTLATTFAGEFPLPAQAVNVIVIPNKNPDNLPITDRLVFRNGDMLRGTLLSAGHDAPLHWRFSDGPEIEFQTKRIGGVLLAPRAEVPLEQGDSVVRFRNGDWLGGSLVSLDKESLHLKSAFGNEFAINRSKLQTLYLSKVGQRAIWEGGTDPDSWWKGNQGSTNNWVGGGANTSLQPGARNKVYLDGAFLLPGQTNVNGGIGKIIDELPERIEISFDIASANGAPAFNLQLFYEKQGNNGLMIQVWQGGMYIYDMSPRKQRAGGGFVGGQPLQIQWGQKVDATSRKHRFQIFADRKNRKATVLVDDVQMAQFNRRGGDQEEGLWGTGIALNTNNGGGTASIFSRLWIAPWNGQTYSAKPGGTGKESIALANGDESIATIQSANTKSVTIDFEGEALEIPREKVLLADFGPASEKNEPALSLTDITIQPRLRLAKGGTLTVENLRIAEGQVVCSSSSFGELKVPLGAFSEIIWSGLDRDIQVAQVKPKSGVKRKEPVKQ